MNRMIVLIALLLFIVAAPVLGATYTVQSVKGIVEVRHGVAEAWVTLKAGDELKPDDTIRTGETSSAIIFVDGKRKIRVPDLTILEIVDLRSINQDELILRLTMEFIRGIPSEGRGGGLHTPSTTIVHGTDESKGRASLGESPSGVMQINGARVLFDHAFYGTCVLRAKEVFRIYPDLQTQYEHRSMVAHALERLGLKQEALNEYTMLSKESLSAEEQAEVEKNIKRLKNQAQ